MECQRVISPVRSRRAKSKRRLPPRLRLFLLVCVAGVVASLVIALMHVNPNSAQPLVQTAPVSSNAVVAPAAPVPYTLPFPTTQPLTDLTERITTESAQPKLHAGVFVVEPETGHYIDVDARRAYSAASMIKLPVLVALLQALDQGKVKFDQNMIVRHELKGGGSGCLQWRPDNAKLSLSECAQLMIIISDNTATNMIVDLLGGKEVCNAQFAQWGLVHTHINDWLPDLPGTNTTSPYDLALLLAKVDKGQLISSSSRAWLFQTLQKNKIRTLLPRGIPPGTQIADKTGDIASLVGDAGIITAANGKRYIVAVSVERPYNDRRANALIRQISKDVYAGITGDVEGIRKLEAQQVAAPHAVHHSRHRRRRHS
jgi:beta-lactamase class A